MRWLLLTILTFILQQENGYTQPGPVSPVADPLFAQGDQAFSLASRNSDSAILLARMVISHTGQHLSRAAKANALNALGWAKMHQGDLDSAVFFLQQSLAIFSAEKRADDIVRVSINLSEIYTKQSNLTSALHYLMAADSICQRTGNLPFHTNVKRQLGIVYRESGDYPKAADYLNQALDGFLKQGDHFRYVGTGISFSILLRNMKLMDSSLAVLRNCLDVARTHTRSDYQVAMVEEHLGETNFATGRYTEALSHYENAHSIFVKLNNRADIAFEVFLIGKTLAKLNRFAEAEKALQRAAKISDTLGLINYRFDAVQELASLYKNRGDWQKAYLYLQQAGELQDSLDLATQKQQVTELKERFETEKKVQEIALLKANNELTVASHNRTRLLQYIFIILFIVSVAIGWLLLARSRIKKRLEAELLRNQIAADLHDDIGSALSTIDISSRIALVKQEDMVTVTSQLKKIQQHAGKTMESMNDIVWSINPKYDDMDSMLSRMREFAAELCENRMIGLQFNVEPGMENLFFSADKRKNIFLIFKEAVNNAVKYSSCSALSVDVSRAAGGLFRLTITDDGNGFDQQTARKGNGLDNMRKRAGNIGADLAIETAPGMGTRVQFECVI